MADLPALPQICPASGLVWVAGGLRARPGGLAVQRNAALFAGPPVDTAFARSNLHDAREVNLLPSVSDASTNLGVLLPSLRAAAPDAVLRMEWWLEAKDSADAALQVLRAAQPLFVHAVITAPEQIGGDWSAYVQRLVDGGIPVAAEIVLRCGAIDRVEMVRRLCLDLLKQGVRPYAIVDGVWLPQADRVTGEAAFDIVRGLRGWISGLAVPQLVEESRSGVRTLRIPAYVERLDTSGVEVVNYEGRRLRYANPPEDKK